MKRIPKFLSLAALLIPLLSQANQFYTQGTSLPLQSADTSHFTGTANFSRYPILKSQGDLATALVHFNAGARTHWHSHPYPQYLFITDGQGWEQLDGEPAQAVKKGDFLQIPANVRHWHGAGQYQAMSHLALSEYHPESPSVTWESEAEAPKEERSNAIAQQPAEPLTSAQLSFVAIAGLSANGELEKLKSALQQGLDNGLSVVQIKEAIAHLYGYLFDRQDLLSAVDRELTTLGALSVLGGVNGQLRSHLTLVKQLGFQTNHFHQLTNELGTQFGIDVKENAEGVLETTKL